MVMRNRILSITRGSIPYVPELRPITGSVTATILMQQLDYWFERHPEGFYKFQDASPDNPAYKAGDSWVEELNFSVAELRNAFDQIGHRHKSKTDWSESNDQFQGKFYCCYTDRRTRLTWYFRNHAMVDAALDALVVKQPHSFPPGTHSTKPPIHPKSAQKMGDLAPKQSNFAGNRESASTRSDSSQFPVNAQTAFTGNDGGALTVNGECQPIQVEKLHSSEMQIVDSAYTETTGLQKTTQKPLQQPVTTHTATSPLGKLRCGSGDEESIDTLVFPQAEPLELQLLAELVKNCRPEARQAVLDELEGARQRGSIRSGLIPFAHSLCKSEAQGSFVPSAGITVAAARARARAHATAVNGTAATAVIEATTPAVSDHSWTQQELNDLPPKMRSRVLAELNGGRASG